MKKTITYLGPSMATFTALAYYMLAQLFGAPRRGDGEEFLAGKNEEVLSLVLEHGGYGALAMETEAEGRVDGPVNSFIQLLRRYPITDDCPMTVIGAVKMPLNFVLMARPGVLIQDIKTVVAHPKALGACKSRIKVLGVQVVESDSNGKAAQEVANNPDFARAAALGPRVAAQKFGLNVLEDACEDKPAFTTFFLLGPKTHPKVALRETNRLLLVFQVSHKPGSLVKVLLPFSEAGLNLRQIHSCYTSNGHYDFAMEIECHPSQVKDCQRAMSEASKHMERHILFGPFPVV